MDGAFNEPTSDMNDEKVWISVIFYAARVRPVPSPPEADCISAWAMRGFLLLQSNELERRT
jgi:hypothetical protein